MLLELRVKDFATVSSCRVEFTGGLNVLSGETGAGKSILVQATLLLLGARATADLVRKGSEKATVEGAFEIQNESVLSFLEELGIDCEDRVLVLRRQIERKGKSRAWVNGSLTSAGLLRRIGAVLVEIQGQHEQQDLLSSANHLGYLDRAGTDPALLGGVRAAVKRFRELREERAKLDKLEAEARERESFVRFQLEELEALDPKPGEMAGLEEDSRVLQNAHRLHHLIGSIRTSLYEDEGAVVERLAQAHKELEQAARLDARLEEWTSILNGAKIDLEECSRELSHYLQELETRAGRMEQILERLQDLKAAARKYNRDEEGLLQALHDGRSFLDRVASFDEDKSAVDSELADLAETLTRLLPELNAARKETAANLDRRMNRELKELGFRGAAFRTRLLWERGDEIEIEGLGYKLGTSGLDRAEFMLRPGPGEDPRPLARIASGGEISRIALALKSILAEEGMPKTIIFDEIDTGVGADLGDALAGRLARVARHGQTLLITHLPQIAARADHHVKVEKVTEDDRVETRSLVVEGESRIREIARMLGGEEGSEARTAHARELVSGTRRSRAVSGR